MEEKRKKQIFSLIANNIVKNENSCLAVNVSPQDVEEISLDLAEALSLNIFIKSGRNGEISYIGRRKICLALKKQLGGKVKRKDYCWIWLGKAYENDVKNIVNPLLMEMVEK